MTTQKILLLAGRYGLSGVPLAQLRLARVLASRGHTVKLVYGLVNEGADLPVGQGFEIAVLDRARVATMILPMIRLLRSYRPDIVFSAGDHLNVITLLAAFLARSNAKLSCSSRVTPYDTYSDRVMSKGWLLKQATRLTMPRADALTCVSKDMVQQYATVFPGSRHVHAYNIIDADSYPPVQGKSDDPWMAGAPRCTIVAAGSLEPWKGFAELIEAMTQVVQAVPDARLTILGEGSQRAHLQSRINALDLSENVRLRGNVDDPLNYFAQAGTFVLSSHVEGLPNVLVEAMLCGCTPVAADCPTGPREVLQDGKYGYLVPVNDPEALAEAILQSIDAPIPSEALSEAIREFRADDVISRHADILGIKRM